MKPRQKRLLFAVTLVVGVGVVASLVMTAFRSNLVFFFSPSEVAEHKAPQGRPFRIGGLVTKGSLKRDGTNVHFEVTDTVHAIPVDYTGILPDLFTEGRGVVAQGTLEPDGSFHATEVLAKHDENYMPPQAADALKRAEEARQRSGRSLVNQTGGAKP